MYGIFEKPNQRITYYPMKTYLNFRNVSLALLVCIFLNSCTKDTDLLSEYIIRDSIKKEVLSFSIRADDIKVSTNGKVASETIIKEWYSPEGKYHFRKQIVP